MYSLLTLPEEILVQIFLILKQDAPDCFLNIVPLVCKDFLRLSQERVLWKHLRVPTYWNIGNLYHAFQLYAKRDCLEKVTLPKLKSKAKVSPSKMEYDFDMCPPFLRVHTLCVEHLNDTMCENGIFKSLLPVLFPSLKYLNISKFYLDTDDDTLFWLENQMPHLQVSMQEVHVKQRNSLHLVEMLTKLEIIKNCEFRLPEFRKGLGELLDKYPTLKSALFHDNKWTMSPLLNSKGNHIEIFVNLAQNNISISNLNLCNISRCAWNFEAVCSVLKEIFSKPEMFSALHSLSMHSHSSEKACNSALQLDDLPTLNSLKRLSLTTTSLSRHDFQTVLDACPCLVALQIKNATLLGLDIPESEKQVSLPSFFIGKDPLLLPPRLESLTLDGNVGISDVLEASLACKRLKSITCFRTCGASQVMAGFCRSLIRDLQPAWPKVTELELSTIVSSCDVSDILRYFAAVEVPLRHLSIRDIETEDARPFLYTFQRLQSFVIQVDFTSHRVDTVLMHLLSHLAVSSPKLAVVDISFQYVGQLVFPLDFKRLPEVLDTMRFLHTFRLHKESHVLYAGRVRYGMGSVDQAITRRHGSWVHVTSGDNSIAFTQCPLAYRC